MLSISNLREQSFLVYGLGLSGRSVVKYFKRMKIKNYKVWDDKKKKIFKSKRTKNLDKVLRDVDYIVLSPGISLIEKKFLMRFKKKIISDIDLIYLTNKNFESIVVTGTNGKSTTCKLINHVLKKNGFKVLLGGNIGTPILDLKIKKNSYVIIEASSFQLSHSQFIRPSYAFLLNITNDHLDWHGNWQNYLKSKFKIFNLQKKDQFAIVNKDLEKIFKKQFFSSKLIIRRKKKYKKIKYKIKNQYLKLNINDENMSFVYKLSKLLRIGEAKFIQAVNSFIGLPHRYEIFLKKKNITFINDSKATSFESSKAALSSNKNIFWIVGGLPKEKDKIDLKNIRRNIIKSYIIGKNINYFKKQLNNKVNFSITKNLKNSIVEVLKDVRLFKKDCSIVLFSPAAASFDQFRNFEIRGNKFKKLCKSYAKKNI